MSLTVVTATTNLERARPCIESWIRKADGPLDPVLVVGNGMATPSQEEATSFPGRVVVLSTDQYLGSVQAFQIGMEVALRTDAMIIACLHDDFEIFEQGWDGKVVKYFLRLPQLGLAGFGGAVGLGQPGMYDHPYDPMSLARSGFRSDLVDAEAHGIRSLLVEPVACLDGFSQIGRRAFWEGRWAPAKHDQTAEVLSPAHRPWTVLKDLGFTHHFYDGALGCLAARAGWETWYIPLRSKHWGGRTAVGDPGYQAWAKQQDPKGDQGFWEAAHKIGYAAFRDVLPLRI